MRRRIVAAMIALLIAGLALKAFWLEPSSLQVQPWDLAIPGWTCPPIRIAVLADIHAGAPYIDRDKLHRIVEMTNAAAPDLILLPGDFVSRGVLGGHFIPPEEIATILAGLQAPLGRYGVLGNHDHELDVPRMWRAFTAAGLPLLDNHARRLQHQGCVFWLAGLDDLNSGYPLSGTLAATFTPGEPAIGFTHNPDLYSMIPKRYALLIAGHTHGGQLRLPLIGAPIVPVKYIDDFARGHLHGVSDLFVSSGIGTSVLPLRFGVPPEISLLTVHAP